MQSYELRLSDGGVEVIEKGAGQEAPYSIRQMGIYLVVDTEAGLVLLWDRKTSIFLKLSPEFKVGTPAPWDGTESWLGPVWGGAGRWTELGFSCCASKETAGGGLFTVHAVSCSCRDAVTNSWLLLALLDTGSPVQLSRGPLPPEALWEGPSRCFQLPGPQASLQPLPAP